MIIVLNAREVSEDNNVNVGIFEINKEDLKRIMEGIPFSKQKGINTFSWYQGITFGNLEYDPEQETIQEGVKDFLENGDHTRAEWGSIKVYVSNEELAGYSYVKDTDIELCTDKVTLKELAYAMAMDEEYLFLWKEE